MNRSKWPIIVLVALVFSACDSGFEDLNQNPLQPTEAQTGAIFNSLVESLRLGWNRQLFLHNEVLYDVTELAVVTAETFGNVEQGAEEVWQNYYAALLGFRELEKRQANAEDPETFDLLMAKASILMAYKTFQITDLFGDIPYTEAGRAYDEEPILRPAYDDHKAIYLSVLDDLESAINVLQSGEMTSQGNPMIALGGSETLFGDNNFKWLQFANSLLLKYYVRIFDVEADLVSSKIGALLMSGASFLTTGDDVVMSPRDQAWLNQGVNWSFREHNKLRMGSNMWSVMSDDGTILDPRARIFFETNNDDEWISFPQIQTADTPQSGGFPYSDSRDNTYENKGSGNIYSSFNYYLIRDEKDIPEILMTAAEVKFLLAEVFTKGIGVPEDPFNAGFNYQLGMWESLLFWQDLMINSEIWLNKADIVSSGDLFTVTEAEPYNWNNAESIDERLALIYTQRWIDAFRQPWEAFSLIRQTQLIPREKETNEFYRFKYPPSESIHNTDNYEAQVAKMGADNNDVQLWWMN